MKKTLLPRNDRVHVIFDLLYGLPASQALLVAHELGFFVPIAKNNTMNCVGRYHFEAIKQGGFYAV